MPTVQIEAQVSEINILKAVEKMAPREFQQFVDKILALRAQRNAGALPAEESELLQRINQKLPEDLMNGYQTLIAKRRGETLSPEEYSELLRLTEAVEKLEADRVAALADLAAARRTTLATLMVDLGIRAPANG